MFDFVQSLLITVTMVLCLMLGNLLYQTTHMQTYEINKQRYLVYQGVTYIECKSVEIEVVSIQARLKEK